MPTPQRVQHNTPALRKNASLSRNGGDADIMELNQQVLTVNVWSRAGKEVPSQSERLRPCFHLTGFNDQIRTSQVLELRSTLDGLEKERDFYFGKLRDIELICQEHGSDHPVLSQIMDILYATEVTIGSKRTR